MGERAQRDRLRSALPSQSFDLRVCAHSARLAIVLMMMVYLPSAVTGQSDAARTRVEPVAVPNFSSEASVASNPVARVAYQDGYLTIDARNSTLAEVLKLVAQKTGALIHVPPGTGMERIVEHSGPGPIKNVLQHLLNGSSFNFVIINSPQTSDPKQILLTLQQSTSPQIVPPPPEAAATSLLWTPPDTTQRAIPLSAEADDTLVAPKETMTPEVLSEFMRQKERELREKALQQYPQ